LDRDEIPMKNFALISEAGFIAPLYLKATRDIGDQLVAVVDPHDSVGMLDAYSFNTRFSPGSN